MLKVLAGFGLPSPSAWVQIWHPPAVDLENGGYKFKAEIIRSPHSSPPEAPCPFHHLHFPTLSLSPSHLSLFPNISHEPISRYFSSTSSHACLFMHFAFVCCQLSSISWILDDLDLMAGCVFWAFVFYFNLSRRVFVGWFFWIYNLN